MVLPPRHLITVSENPGHYDPRDIYILNNRHDKASDLLFRALETVSSCDCVDEGGCENCELSLLHLFEDGTLTDDGKVLRAVSVEREMKSVQREAPW